MVLLETTEGFLRIHVSAANGIAVAKVRPAPAWSEPLDCEPFGGESRVVLSRFNRSIIDVSDASTLSAGETARLVKGVMALRAMTNSNVVIADAPWRPAWIDAGFPVFASVQAAIDYSNNKEVPTDITDRHLARRTKISKTGVSHARTNKSRKTPVERRVSAVLQSAKLVVIEVALFIGAVAFAVHYALQHLGR